MGLLASSIFLRRFFFLFFPICPFPLSSFFPFALSGFLATVFPFIPPFAVKEAAVEPESSELSESSESLSSSALFAASAAFFRAALRTATKLSSDSLWLSPSPPLPSEIPRFLPAFALLLFPAPAPACRLPGRERAGLEARLLSAELDAALLLCLALLCVLVAGFSVEFACNIQYPTQLLQVATKGSYGFGKG